MRARRAAAFALVALACGSTPEGSRSPSLPLPAGSTLHATAPGGLPAPATGRVVIAPPRPVSLPIELVEIQGSDAVLAVHDEAGRPAAFAQRVGPDGSLGPVSMLPRAHVAAAFELDESPQVTIATTEGDELCFTTLSGAEQRARGCLAIRPDVLTRMPGRVLALSAETPAPEEDDDTVQKKQAKPAPKKPSAAPGRKRRPKKEPSAVEKLFSSGRELDVMARWIMPDGTSPLEAARTGLRFAEPMVGMGLIGAASRAERVDVVFYERGKLRGKERRGAFGVAALDEAGTFVEGSRKSFGESKIAAGFLTDHVDPTLLGFGEGSILLGHRGARGKCEVTVVAPFLMQMIPEEDACAIEPRAFFRQGQAMRKAKGKGKAPPLESLPAGLERDKLHRVTGQARWEVGRLVLAQSRAFALYDDKLVSWAEGGTPARTTRPLVAEQSRVFAGAIATNGSAIAHTNAGLVVVDASGSAASIPGAEPRLLAGEDRPDVARLERRLAVVIGGAWVQAEGELRKLTPAPSKARRALHPDTTALAGGASGGLLFELAGPVLTVSVVSPDAEASEATRTPSQIGPGFDAVERSAGGAFVAGRDRRNTDNIVILLFDSKGHPVGQPTNVAIPEDGGGGLRLYAMPTGGAVLTDAASRGIVWIGPNSEPVASTAWPRDGSQATCWDGTPMRSVTFGLEPGKLVPNTAAAQPGTCVTSMAYASDGSFRWVGSTTATIHTRAELGILPATPAPPAVTPPRDSPARRPSTPRAPRCPGEMVLVGEGLCVDRFESTLVDPDRGRYASPDYPPTPAAMSGAFGDNLTRRERVGDVFARAFPLPRFPAWQAEAGSAFVALSREGVRPSGYVSGAIARQVCERAKKRLCKLEEWRTACRGEQNQLFPYGPAYAQGACNVNGPVHPAATLHDNASIGHLDPRLNRVESGGETVLRVTGATRTCASKWGDDAIFDMVGNVDEWVDEEGGAFAGGFYARGTTNGCEALVSNHPEAYFDYSTGVRCCADAR